jgi:hypothetical protein
MFLSSSLLARATVAVLLLYPLTVLHAGAGHGPRADSHAPIGVMGDHLHGAGEFMISYRYMHMDMAGSRIGTRRVSPEFIVQNVPNRFAGRPGQPPTLRVVPASMDMEMHMLGGMYGLSDNITLMAMLPVVVNSMDHITFQGGSGTDRLGNFQTTSKGLGDVGVSGLFRLGGLAGGDVVGRFGLRAPTGDTDNTDDVLTPMGGRPRLRVPYMMQPGSGTWAATPGLSWRATSGSLGWGASYAGVLQFGRNDEGYTRGDEHELSAWASWLWAPALSSSLRLRAQNRERIQGIDASIVAPVQTANPDFQGGDRAEIGLGLNLLGTRGMLAGHRLAAEYLLPFYQDLNGPQLETDATLILGYQYAW